MTTLTVKTTYKKRGRVSIPKLKPLKKLKLATVKLPELNYGKKRNKTKRNKSKA